MKNVNKKILSVLLIVVVISSTFFPCFSQMKVSAGADRISLGYADHNNFSEYNIKENRAVKAAQYTVTFDGNGGIAVPRSVTVNAGESITLRKPTNLNFIEYDANGGTDAPTAQPFGLKCYGWSTSSTATSASYACGSSYTPKRNITLYAVWEKSNTVTLSTDEPTRSGYLFLGWTISPTESTPLYRPGDPITLSKNTTLYARWISVPRLVEYDANGGNVSPPFNGVSLGKSVTLPTPIKTNKITYNANGGSSVPDMQPYSVKCDGWSTTIDATSGTYACGSTYKPTQIKTTLYAVWVKTKVILSSDIPERSGYEFIGWSTNKNATVGSYQPGATVNILGDVTLYAIWKKVSGSTSSGDVEKTTVKFVQVKNDKKITGNVDVSFRQSWFKGDSLNYNHNIARLASQYVMIGYDEPSSLTDKPNLRNALKTIGMDNIKISGMALRDQVNYFIASRKITVDSKQYDLIFIGLIGSYHAQWYSNFDPGRGATHQGFLSAKEYVKTALTNYVTKYGYSKDTTKILITGHSRGGAASNLLAADLIKSEAFAKKENIYTYAFATPNSTTLSERTDKKFDRIYNIVNPEDFVTKCMPVSWGYGRYGQTYVLPSKSNEKNSDYKVYKSNMQKYFSYFTNGKTYTPYVGAEADTRGVVMALTSTVYSVNDFYDKRLYAGTVHLSAQEFFQKTLCHFVSEVATDGDKLIAGSLITSVLANLASSPVYKAILAYFIGNGLSIHPCFENAHQAETYCAYMMSMTESQIKEERRGYLNTVNCPVDVTVIDNETGEVVGKIVNNIIDEEIAAKENSVVMTVDGDSKSFWLPSDGDYEVILTGNDNGTMDYTVSEVDSDAGETERINFYDVEIKDGDSYTGEIISGEFIADEYTITSDNGEVISPDEKFDNSSMQTVEINVTVSGDGYATESMTVTKGDYVTLEAIPEDGYKFDGWYENGKLISKDKSYSFVAKEEHNFVAKFSKNKPAVITTIVADYKYGFNINKYLKLPEDVEYEITYESSDPSVAIVDEDGNITTTGRGITLITSTIVYENGKTETQLKNVEVTYSWWQWLIIIFLFGWIWY